MKFKGSISLLVIFISVFSLIACAYGIFSSGGPGQSEFLSIHGEKIQIYGIGLYRHDSMAIVSQGIAQDMVTMTLGVPLLLIALCLYRKGSLKGKLLLTGTLGYFLYTYVSYCFLWMYNSFFIVYVFIMSASFFAFTLSMMSYDMNNLGAYFDKKLPVKLLGGFSIFFGVMIGMLWLGKVVPPLLHGSLPLGLDHYPTLVIQAMDLGFVVPIAILAGVLIIKRKPFGYLLSSVIYMKGITMTTAVTAMLVAQILQGIKVGLAEVIIFPMINIGIIYCMFLILKGLNTPQYKITSEAKQISQ